eukprot:GHVP01040235.1.p1 GENE.GHVP01040235.1~~GHVP01040235.1.p1  ORF type:complete len:661 (-),score=105.88 GHVP01040235.1:50-2032(-)
MRTSENFSKTIRLGVIDVGPFISFEKAATQMTCQIADSSITQEKFPETPSPSCWFHEPGKFGHVDWKDWPSNRSVTTRGLSNHGKSNSCYFNSVLQALAYCPPLAQDMMSSMHSKTCKRLQKKVPCGMCEFESLIKEMFDPSKSSAIKTPNFIYRILQEKKLKLGKQQCAHEFLFHFFDWIEVFDLPMAVQEDHINHRIKWTEQSGSYLGQIFTGIHRIQRQCQNCLKSEYNFQPFRELNVRVQDHKNLKAALHALNTPEVMHDVKCSFCDGKHDKILKSSIARNPPVLLLTLQRSAWNTTMAMPYKLGGSVKCPFDIDLAPLMIESSLGDTSQVEYQLVSAVAHHGFAQGGHYVALGKRPVHGGFVQIDDEVVMNARYFDGPSFDLNAFMLFYVLKNEPRNVSKPFKMFNEDDLRLKKDIRYELEVLEALEVEVPITPAPSSISNTSSLGSQKFKIVDTSALSRGLSRLKFYNRVNFLPRFGMKQKEVKTPSCDEASFASLEASLSGPEESQDSPNSFFVDQKFNSPSSDKQIPRKQSNFDDLGFRTKQGLRSEAKKRKLKGFEGKKKISLRKARSSQFGSLSVPAWELSSEDESPDILKNRILSIENLLEEIEPLEKHRDQYDKDYDTGKQKKPRKKLLPVDLKNKLNQMQQAAESTE